MGDTDKVVKYVKDAQKHDIEVRPPHINISSFKFTVKDKEIFFSLGAIKGVGQSAVESIIEARKAQPSESFESLEHFFEVVDLKKINKKNIECLIKAGAFDGFGANRAELMSGYSQFIERADQIKKDRELGQASLFAIDQNVLEEEKVQLQRKSTWTRSERLRYEKEVLGFYLSDHPLKGFNQVSLGWRLNPIETLLGLKSKEKVTLLGVVSTFREIITKKGTRMAFVSLEDATDSVEVVVFPDVYAKTEGVIRQGEPLVVEGGLENENKNCKVIAEKFQTLDERLESVKQVVFEIQEHMEPKLEELYELIKNHSGDSSFNFSLKLKDLSKDVQLVPQGPQGIKPSYKFFEDIHRIFGEISFIKFS